MPADVTWTPEVVDEMAARHYEAAAKAVPVEFPGLVDAKCTDWQTIPEGSQNIARAGMRAALSASPLPEAVALIERLIARRNTMADSMSFDILRRDAAAFLARVRGKDGH